MKKILVMTMVLTSNLSTFAQTDIEMGENFSLSSKSNTFFLTDNANGAKPYAKIWNLQGVKNDSIEGTPSTRNDGWQITKQEADELKGNKEYSSYMYNQPGMGSFVFWGYDEYQFRIISDNGIFNFQSGYNKYAGSYSGESITVGLYDENDKLIEKFDMWLDRDKSKDGTYLNTRNAGTMGNPVGQKGKVKKIFKHLQGDSGYVRIVTARYNYSDFDIKIPPVKE